MTVVGDTGVSTLQHHKIAYVMRLKPYGGNPMLLYDRGRRRWAYRPYFRLELGPMVTDGCAMECNHKMFILRSCGDPMFGKTEFNRPRQGPPRKWERYGVLRCRLQHGWHMPFVSLLHEVIEQDRLNLNGGSSRLAFEGTFLLSREGLRLHSRGGAKSEYPNSAF